MLSCWLLKRNQPVVHGQAQNLRRNSVSWIIVLLFIILRLFQQSVLLKTVQKNTPAYYLYDANMHKYNRILSLPPTYQPNRMYYFTTVCSLIFLKKKIANSRKKLHKVLQQVVTNVRTKRFLRVQNLPRWKKRPRISRYRWQRLKRKLTNTRRRILTAAVKFRHATQANFYKKYRNKILQTLYNRRTRKLLILLPRVVPNVLTVRFLLKRKKNRRAGWVSSERIRVYKSRRASSIKKFKINFYSWLKTQSTTKVFHNVVLKATSLNRKYEIQKQRLLKVLLLVKKRKKLRAFKRIFFIKHRIYIKNRRKKLQSVLLSRRTNFSTVRVARYTRWPKLNAFSLIYRSYKTQVQLTKQFKRPCKAFNKKQTKGQRVVRQCILRRFFTSLFMYKLRTTTEFISSPSIYVTYLPNVFMTFFKVQKRNLGTFKRVRNLLNTPGKRRTGSKSPTRKRVVYKYNLKQDVTSFKKNTIAQTTNYSPLSLFSLTRTNKYIKTPLLQRKLHLYTLFINNKLVKQYKMFFGIFILSFLENFLKKKIFLQVNTKDPFRGGWKQYINWFCHKHNKQHKRFNRLLPIREVLEVLILTFTTKDLNIFLYFIKKRLETAHFKKHKKILSIVFNIIKKTNVLYKLSLVKGFAFDIRGKVGVTGNAKKRHIFFSIGKTSTTTQNLKSCWQQIEVWTPTGQMGITCLLQY